MDLRDVGRMLLLFGAILMLVGAFFYFAGKLPIRLGRLPGDISYKSEHTSFYFPIATCIVISIALTLIAWLINRFRR